MKNFNPSDPVHFKKLIVMLDKKFQKIRIHQRELNHMVGLLSSYIDDDIDHLLSTLKEILLELEKINATGGLIAIDSNANIAMPFNTDGMIRGSITNKSNIYVAIY